jgi:hypothetical protein
MVARWLAGRSVLEIHHLELPVGNLRYVATCACGWESAHAGDGAEEDAIAASADHLLGCELTWRDDPDWDDPLDSAV